MTDLVVYRGDNKNWVLTFTDDAGVAIDINGYTIFFTVKKENVYVNSTSDITDALISKDVTSHTNPTSGISSVAVVPADTENLEPTIYKYDMQLKDDSGNILTFIKGNFIITADVTRRSS